MSNRPGFSGVRIEWKRAGSNILKQTTFERRETTSTRAAAIKHDANELPEAIPYVEEWWGDWISRLVYDGDSINVFQRQQLRQNP